MATSKYMSRSNDPKKAVDVTKLTTQAPGHESKPAELQPKSGAEMKTPAPTELAGVAEMQRLKDQSWGRASGLAPESMNPGKSGFALASSLPPGVKAAPANINPHGPGDFVDPVLRNLAQGTARAIDGEDDWQTRPEYNDRAQKVPTTFGHHKPGNDGVVPSKIGGSPMADEMAGRADGLKRTTGEGK